MKKILLFSRDPGGANTVIPLAKEMAKKYEVRLFGKDAALARYRIFGLRGRDIRQDIKSISLSEVKKFLARERPAAVITGTSADDMTEKLLWRAAKGLGIPTGAILDHWVNYGIRFSRYGVGESRRYEKAPRHDYQPDRIFVMDAYAKREMEKVGFASDKLVVSGQPYFDTLAAYQKSFTRRRIQGFRKKYGIAASERLVVFASEPLEMLYREKGKRNHYLGFTEKTVIKTLLPALKRIVATDQPKLTLVLRPHPKEDKKGLRRLLSDMPGLNFKIKILDKCNTWDLMMAADLVCGMSSMFLVESVILGKPVLSIRIGLKGRDEFILARRGAIKTVTAGNQLEKSLRRALVIKKISKYNLKVIRHASRNIISYLDRYLCQN